MRQRLVYIVLFFIISISAFLRIYQLGNVPSSPDWDEVALGYNAYSIVQTGRDEYGEFLPIILRSFDDYKPALYAYLVIPFIKLFDLTVFAVRLPSAMFGILTVIATYFLVKEIFAINNKFKITNSKQIQPFDFAQGKNLNDQNSKHWQLEIIALLSAGLLAISPWHIQFSRIAFEANVGLAFNVFAVLFFLWGLKRPWFLALSSIVMAVNLYAYQSEKVFTPLLLLALVIIFRKTLFLVSKKYIAMAVILGLFVSLPIIHYTLTNKEALSRAEGVSIFADKTQFLKENAQRLIQDKEKNDYLGVVLDNRRITYFKTVVSGYLSHFDLNWLFIRGDIARHHVPNMALLYLWELPFLIIGIYALIFRNFPKRTKALIITWLLIAPVPASITSGVPHAIRAINLLPTFQIFTAIGLLAAIASISNIKYKILKIQIKYLIFTMYFLFLIFNFSYYINQYFFQQNYFYSADWQYGYEEAIRTIQEVGWKYRKIVVSNEPYLDQSYMFFLFYLKYPPSEYQKGSGTLSGGFRETHKFGKFEFRSINWDMEEKDKSILYMGKPDDFPINIHLVKSVSFLNGEEAIKIVEPRE